MAQDELRQFPTQRKIPEKRPPTFILFPFELSAKMKESFETKEAETLELIKAHLKEFKKCYVVSSHGKDSIVMVHLIKRACEQLGIPMIQVWLNHTMNVYKEERDYWKKINKFLGIDNCFRIFYPPKDKHGKIYTVWSVAKEVKHLPHFRSLSKKIRGSYKTTNTPECCDILKKKSVKSYLKSIPKGERFDCVFVGTRAEESRIRSLGVLQRCRTYFTKSRTAYPIRTVTPLSFWKKADIYEYFARYEIPKNPTYQIHDIERMGCASCPAHKNWETRLARDPTIEGFGMLKMNLEILKNTEPQRFEESLLTLKKYTTTQEFEQLGNKSQTKLLNLLVHYNCIVTLDLFLV